MEIGEAAKRVPIYDEDAPELSLEQMWHYRKAAIDNFCPLREWILLKR